MRKRSVRSTILAGLIALPLASAAQAQSGAPATERPEVSAAAQAVQAKVIAWRRDFHQHPELSNREQRTAAKVAEHLRALGLKPLTGIAHHGVVAIITGGKPGPRIALRADMDALPVTEQVDLPFASQVTTTFNGQTTGVMHACGHDAHTGILLGVADALVAMQSRLPGSVMLVFQPSEETPLQMGAEDFAFYAQQVPVMFFFVGATAQGIDPATAPGNHSPLFALDESSLDLGLRALLQVTLDYPHGAPPAG